VTTAKTNYRKALGKEKYVNIKDMKGHKKEEEKIRK
jgi:hypothetical protein